MVLQLTVMVFYGVLGAALGFDVPSGHWFLIVPVAVLAMLAPVSVNAIGVREGIFAFLLASYGVPKSGAVAFAWLAYASVALQSMLGGAFYLSRVRHGNRPRRLSGGYRPDTAPRPGATTPPGAPVEADPDSRSV